MNIWQRNLNYQNFKKEVDSGLKELESKHQGKGFLHDLLLRIIRKLLYFALFVYKLEPPKD